MQPSLYTAARGQARGRRGRCHRDKGRRCAGTMPILQGIIHSAAGRKPPHHHPPTHTHECTHMHTHTQSCESNMVGQDYHQTKSCHWSLALSLSTKSFSQIILQNEHLLPYSCDTVLCFRCSHLVNTHTTSPRLAQHHPLLCSAATGRYVTDSTSGQHFYPWRNSQGSTRPRSHMRVRNTGIWVLRKPTVCGP